MSTTARWIVGIVGFLFAVTAFLPIAASTHIWTAVVLGTIVGTVGLAAVRRAPWAGALTAFVGLWMLVASFVGGVQTGVGHFWLNLLTGLVVVALAVFARRLEAMRV
jgi:hypothetical protein